MRHLALPLGLILVFAACVQAQDAGTTPSATSRNPDESAHEPHITNANTYSAAAQQQSAVDAVTPQDPDASPHEPSIVTTSDEPVASAYTSSALVAGLDDTSGQPDARLAMQVHRSLLEDGRLSANAQNVTIVAHSGAVTVRGIVRNNQEARNVEHDIAAVPGVSTVRDETAVATPRAM